MKPSGISAVEKPLVHPARRKPEINAKLLSPQQNLPRTGHTRSCFLRGALRRGACKITRCLRRSHMGSFQDCLFETYRLAFLSESCVQSLMSVFSVPMAIPLMEKLLIMFSKAEYDLTFQDDTRSCCVLLIPAMIP